MRNCLSFYIIYLRDDINLGESLLLFKPSSLFVIGEEVLSKNTGFKTCSSKFWNHCESVRSIFPMASFKFVRSPEGLCELAACSDIRSGVADIDGKSFSSKSLTLPTGVGKSVYGRIRLRGQWRSRRGRI